MRQSRPRPGRVPAGRRRIVSGGLWAGCVEQEGAGATPGGRIVGKAWNRFRPFEAAVALLGAVAFAVIGPLRDAFVTLPGAMLFAVLILFLAPGTLLTR